MPPSQELLDYLRTRRSVPAISLVPPAPEGDVLQDVLTIASRVPDHGKLSPWRFILARDEGLSRLRARLLELWKADNPAASDAAIEVEAGKRPQAPLLIVLVSRAGEHPKIPAWEQELAVGAAGMNLIHALHAHGYAAQWLSGWPAYDSRVADLLGLAAGERVAGFFYVGTSQDRPMDRDRPDVASLTTKFDPGG